MRSPKTGTELSFFRAVQSTIKFYAWRMSSKRKLLIGTVLNFADG